MSDKKTFPLDKEAFWEAVAAFDGYDYAFAPNHTPSKDAKPAYPGRLLQLVSAADCAGFSQPYLTSADDIAAKNHLGHNYTNCCMFVESVLVGAALKLYGAEFGRLWTRDHHRGAMNTPTEKHDRRLMGPPRAYVDVGLAEELDISRLEKLVRGTTYVVQGAGHTWFIVDYDPETDCCLRLEASFTSNDRPEFGPPPYFGGVAHAALGRVPIQRSKWLETMQQRERAKQYTWTRLRGKLLQDLAKNQSSYYVSMARVLIGDGRERHHVAFPDELPGMPASSAASAYARNESLDHGFFPLGGEMNIHTGVHVAQNAGELFAFLDRDGDQRVTTKELAASPFGSTDRKQAQPLVRETIAAGLKQPVYCMAPGTIVAVRLPHAVPGQRPITDVDNAKLADELTGSANGMVLIRHDLVALDATGKPDPAQRFRFHSLYLHLASPDWRSGAEHSYYANVPWLNAFAKPRHGAVFGADPGVPNTFGRRAWSRTPLTAKSIGRGSAEATVQAYGASYADTTMLKLDGDAKTPATADVVGVQRPPEAHFVRAMDVLGNPNRDHSVLTSTKPHVVVGKGELIGFVQPSRGGLHGLGGFLHWEVLAPMVNQSSDLLRLFQLAEQELGLGASFFKVVRETQADNLLQADELAALLAALPMATNAGHGGRDALFNVSGKPAYNTDELRAVMHDAGRLPFTLEPVAQAPSVASTATCDDDGHEHCRGQNFWYQGTLELVAHATGPEEKSQPTWADAVELDVSFEPPDPAFEAMPKRHKVQMSKGVATLQLAIPATARYIVLTPVGDLHLDDELASRTPDEHKANTAAVTAQLRSLLSVRWRNVIVEHNNEWTAAGLKASLQARYDGASALQPFVDAVAWWGHDEATIDDGVSLFGQGADQLFAQGDRVHNANPVTVAWLVDLLVRRKKLAFIETRAALAGARDPLFAGWVPVQKPVAPVLVGDPRIHALVIAKGEAFGDPVEVIAVRGAQRCSLGSFAYLDGAIAAKPLAPLWGSFTLEVEHESGATAPAPQPIGPGELEFLAPALAGTPVDAGKDQQTVVLPDPEPVSKKSHAWRLDIPFAKHCPHHMKGWITVQLRKKKDAEFEPVDDLGIPFSADLPSPEKRRGLLIHGAFVVGKVTSAARLGPFAFDRYVELQKRSPPRVALALGTALSAIVKQRDVELVEVDFEGIRATVECRPSAVATVEKHAAAAKKSQMLVDARRVGDNRVQIEVTGFDRLVGTFDPAGALRAYASNSHERRALS